MQGKLSVNKKLLSAQVLAIITPLRLSWETRGQSEIHCMKCSLKCLMPKAEASKTDQEQKNMTESDSKKNDPPQKHDQKQHTTLRKKEKPA